MLSYRKNNVRILAVLFLFFLFTPRYCLGWGERTLTDNGKRYSPPKKYVGMDFEADMGVEDSSLQELGKMIDEGIKYSDAQILTKAAILLGYQEKQWNVKCRLISADDLMKKAEIIACYRKNPGEVRTLIDAYNEQSLSFYDPDAAKKLRGILDKIETGPEQNPNTGVIIIHNNARKSNILVYFNDIYMGQVPRNGILRLRNIPAGRINLFANDDDSCQWGPRRIFLGKENVFHWKLYP